MATRTIGTELKLSGEKEFNDAMKGVNSNLKNIRADMARVTAEYDGNADSMEALTAKEKVLQESVNQHRAKVDALTRMYEKQKKVHGENSAQVDKYRLQLTQATTALIKEEKVLEKTAEAIKNLDGEQENAADSAEKAAKKQKQLEDRLQKTQERAEKLKDGLGKLGSATAAMAKATAAGVAALAAAGGVALAGMVNMAKEAAEAAKAAQEAGEELTASQQQWLAFSGQLDTLSATAVNAKSALAGILLPTLSQLSDEGTAFLGDFVSSMNAAAGDTQKQTEILGQYIGKGAKLILEKLPEYIKSGKELLKSVGKGISENKDELLDLGQELLEDLLRSVIDNAPKLAEGGLEMVLQLIEGIDGEDMVATASQLVTRLVNGLAEAAPKLIPAAVKLVSELVVGLAKNAPELLGSGVDLLMNVIDGILSAVGEIPKMWRQVFDVLISAMRSSDSEIMQFGANVVEKIADGILGAWDWLIDWFNGFWDNLFTGRNVDVSVNAEASGAAVDGSHATGLRYVPFDGYLAELHRGEAILPAAEAEAYRSGKTAGAKIFNLTINTTSLSQAEADALIEYMNRKLGDDL